MRRRTIESRLCLRASIARANATTHAGHSPYSRAHGIRQGRVSQGWGGSWRCRHRGGGRRAAAGADHGSRVAARPARRGLAHDPQTGAGQPRAAGRGDARRRRPHRRAGAGSGQAAAEYERQMLELPNLPDPSVPLGADDRDNQILRTEGTPRKFDFTRAPTGSSAPTSAFWTSIAASRSPARASMCSRVPGHACSGR